ncbi:16S rRNA (cytidine(1402)-2'-O)-methyltransferase, partial [Streptomyces sp. NPDC003362]
MLIGHDSGDLLGLEQILYGGTAVGSDDDARVIPAEGRRIAGRCGVRGWCAAVPGPSAVLTALALSRLP